MKDIKVLRCTISDEILYQKLKSGLIFSLPGTFILLYAALFFSVDQLKTWGFLIFILAMGLIALGCLPYRRLQRLQAHPNELHLLNHGAEIHTFNHPPFYLAYSSIQSLKYYKDSDIYGISIYLKNKNLDSKIENLTRQRYKCDLFLPFFSQSGFNTLKEIALD